MLVLSRQEDQEVCLPDLGINIKVLEIKGNRVRLGIDAPREIHVLRGEMNEFGNPQPQRQKQIGLLQFPSTLELETQPH